MSGVFDLRHTLHRSPELAFNEKKTSEIIRGFLQGIPLDMNEPILETDVMGVLRGGAGEGPGILLRADIDALPILEKTKLLWTSENPGASHSCGHDGHTAILAGTLAVLSRFKESLRGSVGFVFQPAEEKGGGGKRLIEKGLLRVLGNPSAVYGLHGWPGLPEGKFASIAGPMMAAENRFSIAVEGRGGHGGKPHQTVDPIVTTGSLVSALQSVVSRNMDPQSSVVVSIGSIHGGDADNVIPGCVTLRGTIRYFDEKNLTRVKDRIKGLCEGVCGGFGADCEVEFFDGYIPLVNNADAVDRARLAIGEYLGDEAWQSVSRASMAAEDFAYYLREIPGAFLWLGLGEDWQNLHQPGFDFNDRVLAAGITGFCAIVLSLLT